jgi:hypothetical protein
MNTNKYDIYFRGENADGYDIETVKTNLAKIFQADDAKIAALFSGKTCLLKKGLDKENALKYQTALKKAGAKIIIKASQGNATAADKASEPNTAATPAQSPSLKERLARIAREDAEKPEPAPRPQASQEEVPEGLYLAPVGSDLLKPSERQQVKPVEVDVSAIELTAADFKPVIAEKPTPPAPDTSHIDLADVGEDLLVEHPVEMDLPFPDISALNLDEPGVRLSAEKEAPQIPAPDLSALSLAEPGVRLSKEKDAPPPPPPDTSHLHLD